MRMVWALVCRACMFTLPLMFLMEEAVTVSRTTGLKHSFTSLVPQLRQSSQAIVEAGSTNNYNPMACHCSILDEVLLCASAPTRIFNLLASLALQSTSQKPS